MPLVIISVKDSIMPNTVNFPLGITTSGASRTIFEFALMWISSPLNQIYCSASSLLHVIVKNASDWSQTRFTFGPTLDLVRFNKDVSRVANTQNPMSPICG